MKINFRDIIRNWDAKDVRNLIVTLIALIIPVYFQTITGYISNVVINIPVNISTMYIDHLYYSASSYPIQMTILMTFGLVFTLPIVIMFTNKLIMRPISQEYKIIKRFTEIKNFYFLSFLVFLLLIITTVFLMISITTVIFPVSAYIDFNKQLDSMATFITIQEKNDVISKWALMTTKKDHDIIMDELSDIAKAHKSTLPSAF